MNRFATAAAAALLVLAGPACGPSAPRRPNVLLLVMDTTRADRCSFLGYERPTTPRLAEFAKDAVVFTDAWSPSGWTGTAHASLFTGLTPERHRYVAGSRTYLGEEFPTLAEMLARAGYATGCYSNNLLISQEFGMVRGFQQVVPPRPVEVRTYPWAKETHDQGASWAQAQAKDGKPFFLFINDMETHLPYTPLAQDQRVFLRGDPTPAEIAAGRGLDFEHALRYTLGDRDLTPRELGVLSDLYDAEIAALDREIGDLLDRLRRDGLLDSTLVVICADHGENFGEHHRLEHGPHDLHRTVRHVPLLVRFPGAFDGGRRVESVVRLEDVMPTVLSVCGVTAPRGLDGAILGAEPAARVARAAEGADPSEKKRFEDKAPGVDGTPMTIGIDAVFDGSHHLLEYSDGRVELFDVRKDPLEAHDLAPGAPEVVARMRKLLHGR